MKASSLPLPLHEKARLLSVLEYGILDTQKEEQLDSLTQFIAGIFQVPITLITILDEKRQWFKSNFGLTLSETERSISFCQYTIMEDEIFEIKDTALDERFKDNPLVTGNPLIRYYCGAPLKNDQGFMMGSLAIIDTVPRELDNQKKHTLQILAQMVVNHFELNRKKNELHAQKDLLETKVAERTRELENAVIELKRRDEKIISINNELSRLIYKASHDLLGPIKTIQGLISLGLSEDKVRHLHQYLSLIGTTTKKLDQALVNLLKVISIKDPADHTIVVWEVLISHAISKAEKRNEGKSLDIENDIETSHTFESDCSILEMILEELFANSMQYNRNRDVKITVKVRETDDDVVLRVADNGIGMREDEKHRIFEMFFKNSKSRGSGLGLYMVKSAVEKLNGSIGVERTTNSGTEFLIRFPRQNLSRREEPSRIK